MYHCLAFHVSAKFIEIPTALVLVLLLVSLTPADVSAHCRGKHSGNHPHCPPPTECTDEFPGFSYSTERTRRKDRTEIRLASSDGCRTELVVVESDDGRGGGPFHMTADRSQGVLLWQEEPGDAAHYVVYRQDFKVALNGKLSLEPPVQLLPLYGEDVPPEDELYYFSNDIWGDATHEALYLMTTRLHVKNPGPEEDVIEELLIYDLNNMTDVREIYRSAQAAGEWTCPPDVDYPQFVPTCYRPQEIRFNPSGTRLYIEDNIDDTQGQRWDATLRIHIDRDPAGLAHWEFSAPELVYTGGPRGNLARPDMLDPSILPSPEFLAIRLWKAGMILDADTCASAYAPFADGFAAPDINLSETCVDPNVMTELSSFLHEGGDSWQSSDALLFSRLGNRHYDIYRRYVTGEFEGIEQLLIENARGADTGL